jgi:ankyrin
MGGKKLVFVLQHNITPLHVAAKWGKSNMVSLLLDKVGVLSSTKFRESS